MFVDGIGEIKPTDDFWGWLEQAAMKTGDALISRELAPQRQNVVVPVSTQSSSFFNMPTMLLLGGGLLVGYLVLKK